MMDVRMVNSLVLAYLGDSIYEEYVRCHLIKLGINKVNELQEAAIRYVSAKRQAYYLDNLFDYNFFSLEEVEVIKRARNSKSHANPKGCSVIEYKKATGLEAIIGYWYLEKKYEKIEAMMEEIFKIC